MREPAFLRAATPLLADGLIDALEWSFDTAWRDEPAPVRDALLGHYASAGRLLGHGVSYSLLSADPADDVRKARWLERWRGEQARHPYRHLSEHIGFMTAPGYQRGPPLPMPLTPEVVTLGRDRLNRLVDASNGPVGLENLAFAFSRREVLEQGELLERLLAPTGGFVVLDLHNLWCQAVNFGLDPAALLDSYPLARVHELHVSGGSWAETSHGPVRRDTHDGTVPFEVLELLQLALRRCPEVRFVVVERLGDSFESPDAAAELRADVMAVRGTLSTFDGVTSSLAKPLPLALWPDVHRDDALAVAQSALYATLDSGPTEDDAWSTSEAVSAIRSMIEHAEPRMLATGEALMRRWGRRNTG